MVEAEVVVEVVSIGPTIGWRALRNPTVSTRQGGTGSLSRMITLDSLREFHRYGDEADRLVFGAAAKLSDEQLDRSMDLGLGSVRRICRHLLAGESVWLERMEGHAEVKWPDETKPLSIAAMVGELEKTWARRDAFLASILDEHLARVQQYRDSKGSLFTASLFEMLVQNVIHAAHHRAQIVNGIRRVGGRPPEIDYMYLVRKPADRT